jgi:hypothetical protein
LNSRNELIAVYERTADGWRADVVMPEPLA